MIKHLKKISLVRGHSVRATVEHHWPEKKCATSSLEQPKGRPRRRITASLLPMSWLGPLRFTIHSISLILDRNTANQTKSSARESCDIHGAEMHLQCICGPCDACLSGELCSHRPLRQAQCMPRHLADHPWYMSDGCRFCLQEYQHLQKKDKLWPHFLAVRIKTRKDGRIITFKEVGHFIMTGRPGKPTNSNYIAIFSFHSITISTALLKRHLEAETCRIQQCTSGISNW